MTDKIPEDAIDAALGKLGEAPLVREFMRAALEAAAPHLMAQTWDECVIPDEAVEAAARTLAVAWDYQDEKGKAHWRGRARLALEAAAPHLAKPRTITTAEELDALPDMTVVRTDAGSIVNIVGDRSYFFGYEASAPRRVLALPATVLYEPQP